MWSVFFTKTSAVYWAIGLCAAFVFVQEFKVLEGASANRLVNISPPIDGGQPLALSLRATHEILRGCERALSPPGALVAQGQVLENNAKACQQIAERILSLNPSHGYAHLIAALAARHLGRLDVMRVHLNQSAAFAPFEGWLAQRRLALAFDLADQGLGPPVASDIDTVLTTQAGAEFLTRFYIYRPEIRAMITQRLQQAVASNQIRFLNLLKKDQARS